MLPRRITCNLLISKGPNMFKILLLLCNILVLYCRIASYYTHRIRPGILVQVTIYRRLRIGRDGHLDQSEAYDIS